MNWTLFIAVALSVAYFGHSGALASAYGLAVCGLMSIRTVLAFYVIRYSGATSYFIGRDTVLPSSVGERVARWESKIFVHMHRNASAISEHLKLPGNAVVELGALVEI